MIPECAERPRRTPAKTPRPKCRHCDKPLRRVSEWRERRYPGQVWGDYGDNFFCGLRCGYGYAVEVLGAWRR